jgi:hypothetical protein
VKLPVIGNPWLLAGAAVAAAALGFGAGWTLNGWRLSSAVDKCRAEAAEERRDAAEFALDQLQLGAASMAQAVSSVAESGRRAAQATDAARKRWEAHVQALPLPEGCRRDPGRAEALREAAERAR